MTKEELHYLFESELKPKFKSLEKVRKSSKDFGQNLRLLILGIIAGVIYLVFYQYNIYVLCLVALFATYTIYYFFNKDINSVNFKERYKEKITKRLIQKMDPQLIYIPLERFPKKSFIQSGIFIHKPDHYKGDDLIQGKLNETSFQFSNIHALRTEYTGTGSGTVPRTIFKGIFYEADFNQPCKSDLYIVMVSATNFMGKLGEFMKKNNPKHPNLIRIEDSVFDKIFVIYGNDENEAHQILHPEMRAKLIALYQNTGEGINLSIVDSKIYIAVNAAHKYFEPVNSSTSLEYETVEKDFLTLKLFLNLAKELNL